MIASAGEVVAAADSLPSRDALPPAGALAHALERVAARAAERDREPVPVFPHDAIGELESVGALAFGADRDRSRPPAADELALVRAIARADASVGRIVDGHLNAVERLAVQAPAEVRDRELGLVRARELRLGVWGADPRPEEGQPARIVHSGGQEVLTGVKTFCSGAGGLDRALVLGRDPAGDAPAAVWIDVSDRATVIVDESWYRGSGLRASVSHRVVFDAAPVLARFGSPGALSAQPWFSRDALRTAATWAGMADRALEAALDELAVRPGGSRLEALAAGRMLSAQRTITAWLDVAARAMDGSLPDGSGWSGDGWDELRAIALHARAAICAAVRLLLDEAARACGSHPFATGSDLDRARRDLELFLLQHRLDPALAAAGAAALAERAGGR